MAWACGVSANGRKQTYNLEVVCRYGSLALALALALPWSWSLVWSLSSRADYNLEVVISGAPFGSQGQGLGGGPHYNLRVVRLGAPFARTGRGSEWPGLGRAGLGGSGVGTRKGRITTWRLYSRMMFCMGESLITTWKLYV